MSARAGYVLAGGKSTRMGRDKALLPFHGRTLAEATAACVAAAAGSATLVGGPPAAGEFRRIPDLYPGEGPLGGILSALEDSTAGWNLIVACDMPGLEAGFLRRLLDTAGESDGDALVPRSPAGRLEPLCAAYHRRGLGGLAAAFESGIRKIAVALEAVRTVTWAVAEVSYFQNVNTPEEWAQYGR